MIRRYRQFLRFFLTLRFIPASPGDRGGKKIRGIALLFSLIFAMSLTAGESPVTRVQIIAPSTPSVADYIPVTLVARTDSWDIDHDFTGDIWLWTDGPWVRPFHVAFTPKDHGVIELPLKFSLPVLQRIETYTPGGGHHAWSNPVMAKEEGYNGKRLLWGMMGECNEPGLDFCLTWDGTTAAQVGEMKIIKGYKNDPFYFLPKPSLDTGTKESIKKAVYSGREASKIDSLYPDQVISIAYSVGNILTELHKQGNYSFWPISIFIGVQTPSPSIILTNEPDCAYNLSDNWQIVWHFDSNIGLDKLIAVLPKEGGYIGVWADDDSPDSIWNALKKGEAYASWRSRIIIDWRLSNHLGSDKKGSIKVKVAGEGPYEEIHILKQEKGKMKKVLSKRTDSFHLEFEYNNILKGSSYYIIVREPGSARKSHAIAGPIKFP